MKLVTGGLGVMGTTLVKGLLDQGNRVRVLDIPNHPHRNRLDGTGAEVFSGDITRPETMKGAFDGVGTIYHLAAILLSQDPARFRSINVDGTRNVVEAGAGCGAKHLIYVSSISVTYPYTTPYSLSKREAEALVKSQDKMAWTIVRPTLAYNEHGGEEFMMFMDYLKRYPIVPFIGSGKAMKNPVHVDDLMQGFLAIANNPKAHGKTYNFCGSEEISMRDLGKLMLQHQQISKPFVTIPLPVCKLIAATMGKVMKRPPLTWNGIAGVSQNANPDWTAGREDLNYHPIGIHEGMERSFPLHTRGDVHDTPAHQASTHALN